MKLLCHCQLHCDGDIFPLFVQNMTLIFSSNWDKIKSSPCKWISPLGTAYWILGYLSPPPPANMSVALPCFLRWSLVAKSLCVFVSYHIPHQHRNTTIRERSPLICGVPSESYNMGWMQLVPSVLQESPSRIVNHHYLIIIPVTLWLSIPVMTIVTLWPAAPTQGWSGLITRS